MIDEAPPTNAGPNCRCSRLGLSFHKRGGGGGGGGGEEEGMIVEVSFHKKGGYAQ